MRMSLRTSALPAFKVSATGNDFLLIDLLAPASAEIWAREFAFTPRADWVRGWCDRHEGLGADGLVFLEPVEGLDFKWDFFNSDGGNAEMCGNAARAVALYMQRAHGKNELHFSTRAGTVQSWVRSTSDIEVRLPAILEADRDQILSWSGTTLAFDFIRAGVPHAVLKVESIEDTPALRERIAALKREPRFTREGVNVTLIANRRADRLESVTFERGVEDFTRACGTGAVAAAESILRGEEQRKIEVQVPGGTLFVILKDGHPHLIGPAKLVAEMHVIQEATCP